MKQKTIKVKFKLKLGDFFKDKNIRHDLTHELIYYSTFFFNCPLDDCDVKYLPSNTMVISGDESDVELIKKHFSKFTGTLINIENV